MLMDQVDTLHVCTLKQSYKRPLFKIEYFKNGKSVRFENLYTV